MKTIKTLGLALATTATLLGAPAVSQAVPAAPTAAKSCVSGIENRNAVIMVHGLNSNKGAWGTDDDAYSMLSVVKKQVPDAYVETFDYSKYNKQWVDNPNIGPKLGDRIACLATSTKRKVIVIGHSMGGLATRYALQDNQDAAKGTGLVITIGTPHLGSLWANGADAFLYAACNPVVVPGVRVKIPTGENGLCSATALQGLSVFNKKITSLPKFPSNIPVEAIAGDMTLKSYIGNVVDDFRFYGDGVVNTISALQEMAHEDKGGGKKTATCSGHWIWELHCWHSGLTHHQPVEDQVIASIKKFLSTQPTPLTFHGMTINLPPGWKKGTVYGDKGQGVQTTGKCVRPGFCQGFLLFNRYTGRQNAVPSNEYSPDQFWHPGNDAAGCVNRVGDLPGGYTNFPSHYTKRTTAPVGNRTFTYTEWKVDCFYNGTQNKVTTYTQRVWYDPQSKIYIVDEFNSKLWDILKAATWQPYPYTPIPAPFVGKWHVHGGGMDVNKDGTGSYYWNNGECFPGAGYNCTARVKVKFIHDSGAIFGTVVGKPTFEPWNDGVIPPEVTPTTTIYPVGSHLGSYTFQDTSVLVDLDRDPSGNDGNPYLCGPHASQDWATQCN